MLPRDGRGGSIGVPLLAPLTARIVTGLELIARLLLAPLTARIVTGLELITRLLLAPLTARIVTGQKRADKMGFHTPHAL
jgi:hypothetical protein